MFQKLILDPSKFFSKFVSLGGVNILENDSYPCYIFLPVSLDTFSGETIIDWTTVEHCLGSPVFQSTVPDRRDNGISSLETLNLINGPVEKQELIGSLVFTPHSKKLFFIDDIFYDINAHNQMKDLKSTYEEYYMQKYIPSLFYLYSLFIYSD